MSILIKGLDMPKDCGWRPCMEQEPIYDANGLVGVRYYCQAIENLPFKSDKAKITDVDQRLENCPLSEIPTPHGDLIDRDDLLAYFDRKAKGKTAEEALKLLYTALKAYPTVIGKEIS